MYYARWGSPFISLALSQALRLGVVLQNLETGERTHQLLSLQRDSHQTLDQVHDVPRVIDSTQ